MLAILIILIVIAVLAFLGIILVLSYILAIFQGAPFIATDNKKIVTILKLADIKPRQKVLDLGSGDGRLVIALAQAGVQAYGYEINPFLVWWSRWKIKRAGLSQSAFIYRQNFWSADFSSFDLIIVFGIPNIMDRLEKKLKAELPNSARVVSNGFVFPHWQYLSKEGQIYLYNK